jgi:hypothetical protein
MSIMDERLLAIAEELGVFLRKEAIALGYDDYDIARRVADHSWHRVRWGAYTSGDRWRSLDEAGRFRLLNAAAYRQARAEVALSHISAVAEHGAPLWGLDLSLVHLTRVDGRAGRKESGVQQHQGLLPLEDTVEIDGRLVTSPTRAALELTTVADTEACLCVIDNLVNRGLTSVDELRARYAQSMHFWPNTLKTDLVLRLVDGLSQSVGETRCRYLCWRHGLPAPTSQHAVRDESGAIIAYVDLAWPAHGVFLEFDGRVKYERYLREGESVTDAVLREKHREERICELTGWRCIRVTWSDLERPELLVARLRRLLFPEAVAS